MGRPRGGIAQAGVKGGLGRRWEGGALGLWMVLRAIPGQCTCRATRWRLALRTQAPRKKTGRDHSQGQASSLSQAFLETPARCPGQNGRPRPHLGAREPGRRAAELARGRVGRAAEGLGKAASSQGLLTERGKPGGNACWKPSLRC